MRRTNTLSPLGGRATVTSQAQQALLRARQGPAGFLQRLLRGDWGEVSDEQRAQNDAAEETGGVVRAVYTTTSGEAISITTSADRTLTRIRTVEQG
jgi:hypothetical protein